MVTANDLYKIDCLAYDAFWTGQILYILYIFEVNGYM